MQGAQAQRAAKAGGAAAGVALLTALMLPPTTPHPAAPSPLAALDGVAPDPALEPLAGPSIAPETPLSAMPLSPMMAADPAGPAAPPLRHHAAEINETPPLDLAEAGGTTGWSEDSETEEAGAGKDTAPPAEEASARSAGIDTSPPIILAPPPPPPPDGRESDLQR